MPDKWSGVIYWRAAATYQNGMWWPVLEVPVSGMAPFRVCRGAYSNHGAAYAAAKELIRLLDNEAMDFLAPYHLVRMSEGKEDNGTG